MTGRIAILRKVPFVEWISPPLFVVLGLFGQFVFKSVFAGRPFILLYPAVAVGCFIGNRSSTLLATLLGAIGAWLWFFPGATDAQTFSGLAIFVMSGVIISFLSEFVVRGMENQIRAQEDLKNLANSIPILAWMAHADGSIFWYNNRWYDYTGTTEKEMEGWGWQSVHDPKVLPDVMQKWKYSISTGTPFEMTFPLRSKTGEYRAHLTRVVPVKDASGKLLRWFGTNTDIEDTTIAQREIIDTLESMSDAFFAIDKNWKITRINDHFEKVIGVKRDEQIGKDLRELYFNDPSYSDSKYMISYRKAMDERVFQSFEDYYEPLNLWTEVRVYPKSDGGLAVFFTDIGERVAQQKRLQVEKHKLETIFYGADFPMVLFRGPNLVYEMANEKYLELISFRDVIGKPLLEALPEIASSDYPTNIKRVYDTGEPLRTLGGQTPILNPKTGQLELKYFDTSFARISDGPDRDYLVIGSAMDVTERVSARKALEESTQKLALETHKLETIFQETPAAMALWRGKDFVFEKVNPLYQAIFPDRELVGKPFLEACPEFVGFPFIDYLNHVLETGEPFIGREEYAPLRPRKDGPLEDRYYDFTYLRINDAEGKPYGVYDHAIDVTEKVKSRLELEAAKQEAERARVEAERANELKSAFLANMSHEIRTPLGAMVGFADLLRDPGLSREEHSNYINIMTRNGDQLSTIINDILDLSKVESGHLKLEYTETRPQNVAAEVVSLLRIKANEKDLALEYSSDLSTPVSIVTDPLRLRQILLNVVGNAIKFTPAGSVRIKSYGTQTPEKTALRFEVIDTGIGILPNDSDKIFDAFVQADGGLSRQFGGTGLGLALSRQLARQLGGDVSIVRSTPGKGSTFLIEVVDRPELRAMEERSDSKEVEVNSEPSDGELNGVNVLVVDDSPDNRQLIWHYLSKYGAVVDFAENGLMGYRKALSGDFDIVLMDIQMPEMDGYVATQKLREAGYRRPVIALTAHAMAEVRKKCLSVGCTDHLTKPIKPKQLVGAIKKYAVDHNKGPVQ